MLFEYSICLLLNSQINQEKVGKDNYLKKYYLFQPFLMRKTKERKLIMIKKDYFLGENYSQKKYNQIHSK